MFLEIYHIISTVDLFGGVVGGELTQYLLMQVE